MHTDLHTHTYRSTEMIWQDAGRIRTDRGLHLPSSAEYNFIFIVCRFNVKRRTNTEQQSQLNFGFQFSWIHWILDYLWAVQEVLRLGILVDRLQQFLAGFAAHP